MNPYRLFLFMYFFLCKGNNSITSFIKLLSYCFSCWHSEYFKPFPNKPWFLRVCRTCFWKTLWEEEKLLVMSNFSLSHSVFYPFGELSAIFIMFKIAVCREWKRFRFMSACADCSRLKLTDIFRKYIKSPFKEHAHFLFPVSFSILSRFKRVIRDQ